jgi:hypothetical protein
MPGGLAERRMPGDGHVRCGGRPRETGRAESRHRALGRSHNVKIREGQVASRPVYLALGVTVDGERDVLGLWAGEHGDGEGFGTPTGSSRRIPAAA